MKSSREEIHSLLIKRHTLSPLVTTDEIISIIEKRIESLLPELYEPFERMTAERIIDMLRER